MFRKGPQKNSIDIEKVNEDLDLLNKMLKVLFFVLIVGAIMIITHVVKEWQIFPFPYS